MELPGFEPGAFPMRRERDTTTLQSQDYLFTQIASP
jgi:hypothetical protein